ncbi:MAG: spore protease YyaC [bacterium]
MKDRSNTFKKNIETTVSYKDEEAKEKIYTAIKKIISLKEVQRDIVIICIGTDRASGDSLGPFVGSFLQSKIKHIPIYGSLQYPVTAINLEKTIKTINYLHNKPYIIAIDSALSKRNNIGIIKVQNTPLKPGTGVNKDFLSEVGDLSIVGVVNIAGHREFEVLQSTRIYEVVKIAKIISAALYDYLFSFKNKREVAEKQNKKQEIAKKRLIFTLKKITLNRENFTFTRYNNLNFLFREDDDLWN